MGAGGSIPESAEDALAKGFTQEQIDEYIASQVGNNNLFLGPQTMYASCTPVNLTSMQSNHPQSYPTTWSEEGQEDQVGHVL